MDPRYAELAEVLVGFSIGLKEGESILIDAFDAPRDMVVALVEAARRRGARPHVNLHDNRVTRAVYRGGDGEQFAAQAAWQLAQMKKMQAYVGLRGSHNIFEMSDVAAPDMQAAMKALRPVLNWRVDKTRWVVLRWPTPAMAQQAGMSTSAFEDFYFRVCCLDYARMQPGMAALKALMEATDQVHIQGPGETDLTFSIRGIGVVTCGGGHNIPDGEVFTSPVKTSVNGVLAYNTTTVYQGVAFDKVRLVFKQGKIVEATSSNTKRLNEILDSDAGARYIGEFALGFNPHILQPMQDILFDEKIAGSFHFTPGQAYVTADNGNRSQVHWDMVCIQRPEFGGGEIRFDGTTVRKDGRFVVAGCDLLNPEHLLGPAKKQRKGR